MSMQGHTSSVSTFNDLNRKCVDFTATFDSWVERIQTLKRQQTTEFDKQYKADVGILLIT